MNDRLEELTTGALRALDIIVDLQRTRPADLPRLHAVVAALDAGLRDVALAIPLPGAAGSYRLRSCANELLSVANNLGFNFREGVPATLPRVRAAGAALRVVALGSLVEGQAPGDPPDLIAGTLGSSCWIRREEIIKRIRPALMRVELEVPWSLRSWCPARFDPAPAGLRLRLLLSDALRPDMRPAVAALDLCITSEDAIVGATLLPAPQK